MKRLQRPDYNRTDVLPPRLEDWLPPHHPARFVRDLVDSLDLPSLGFKVPTNEQGGSVVDPKPLLAVWLFGWMERVRSSRRLELACYRDIAFVWLSGALYPDHNTLWRFWKANREVVRTLFKLVVRLAADAGLIGWALHALDGTKMQAAGSPDSALWRSKLQKMLDKLDQLTDEQMRHVEMSARDDLDFSHALPDALRDEATRRALIGEWLKKKLTTSTSANAKASAPPKKTRATSKGVAGKAGATTAKRSSTTTAT